MSYLYSNGDKVWHYDARNDRLVRLTVRHTMSGWSYDDWEYYNCIGENYDEDGDDIWEVSQHEVFATMEEANQQACKLLQHKIDSADRNVNELREMLARRSI